MIKDVIISLIIAIFIVSLVAIFVQRMTHKEKEKINVATIGSMRLR